MNEYEKIRRAHYVEGWSIRKIAAEYGHCRRTVRKALQHVEPPAFASGSRPAPVLGSYQAQIETLLLENEGLPLKQRYTGRKIFELVRQAGYAGSESGVRRYVGSRKRQRRQRQVFLPLAFDPGADAQMDWGEGVVELAGVRQTVQLFVMRLNYSRLRFVLALPFQKQEAFFEGHVQAFDFFGGVPKRITYDNLKTAVLRILEGRQRTEQEHFVRLRSHYLFDSRFCTPGQAHEKGGVESDVGYVRRNFLVPIPAVANFSELNAQLRAACLADAVRTGRGQTQTVAERWAAERAHLLPLPGQPFETCVHHQVSANPYSQVVLDTNRYSVPTTTPARPLTLKAFTFAVQILLDGAVLAQHPRCFGREQDLLDPYHYLDLLEQRPGAFEHAQPIRQWRTSWPPVYEQLLAALRQRWPDGRSVREFLAVLKLQRSHPPELLSQAIQQALALGAAHRDGVELCLRQLLQPAAHSPLLDLSATPQLAAIGRQPLNLQQYDQLLGA